MEGLLFLVILVVASLLRGGARQKRQAPPPPRPRRPMLDPETQGGQEPFPVPRPARRTIFTEDSIYMFPKKKKEPASPAPQRDSARKRAEEKPAPVREARERLSAPVKQEGFGDLFKDRNDLARGIILAEVLGPPVSKRKNRGFI